MIDVGRRITSEDVGKLRDGLLPREVFDTSLEPKVLVARWRRHCNEVRSHSSLGYQPPAPDAILPWGQTLGPRPVGRC